MSKNISLPKALEKKIETAFTHVKKDFGQAIAEDLKKMYGDIIRDFYRDYSPKMYSRTYNTYTATNLYGKDVFGDAITMYDDGVKVSMFVSSDYIKDSYKVEAKGKKPKGWVFERTFTEGIHGFDSPIQSITNISSDNSPVMIGHVGIKPFSPSPKARLDKEFKKYKSSIALRKRLHPVFEKAMLGVLK